MTDDLSALKGHGDWKWYGYAGHLIVASRCAYHLCTRVGDFLVSTVGDYRPDGPDKPRERIGCGDDDFFETYVFRFSGEESGNPQIDYSEIDSARYTDSRSAEAGHYRFCWKYHSESN